MDFTVIDFYGEQKNKCGYCKNTNCSVSKSMHAYTMTPQDYQDLIDRGWRRCGHYCYVMDNYKTCCPCYTIKCDALEFKLTKSHKKILKRMNRFLRDGKRDKNEQATEEQISTKNASNNMQNKDGGGEGDVDSGGGGGGRDEVQTSNVAVKDLNLDAVAKANNDYKKKSMKKQKDDQTDKGAAEAIDIENLKKLNDDEAGSSKKSFDGGVARPPCKKAKQMRLERKLAKQAAKGLPGTDLAATTVKTPRNQEKTLIDYINDTRPDDKHKLQIVLVPSSKQIYTDTSFALYRKYQLSIHNDNPERLQPRNLQRFLYNTPLKLDIIHVKSKDFDRTLPQTYALYQKYQTKIHNDPPSEVQEYLDFLQRSPIKLSKPSAGPAFGYGSFHQQYWLDNKLIAVAVLDILPQCVSSVYFFYDPDYSFLSLGTYSSLRELEFVQQLASTLPALKYYYMGFYIHCCPKMRYKGKLQPSYLLCPETYTWHLLTDEIRAKLDADKYQRFNNDLLANDINLFTESDINSVLLLIDHNTCVKYGEYITTSNSKTIDRLLDIIRSRIYNKIAGEDDGRNSIIEFGRLVGQSLAHRILYLKM